MDNLNSTEYLIVMSVWVMSGLFFLVSAIFLYKKCGHIENEESKKKAG